ncbi:hypothetical protein SAMN06265337_3399 [Hymenobacter gelipurpurascens]|uniref:TraB family protein n=1 Tax=Hymenobacter gelipurpurascens TaxID=89968 RepID=A0A212UE50_9BACT|nr:DUF5694 domain-containing protein [Hymenobacter gelipurpurascens]SNC76463.1 hypothetical protein SAMN06265337_3399 [Hymenobacter gelipurpurascens]
MKLRFSLPLNFLRPLWLLALLLGTASVAVAQQPLEVLIVASSHVNMSPAEEYRPIIEKLKAYKPEMVFSENVSATEMQQMPDDAYPRALFLPRYRYVQQRNPKAKPLTARAVAKADKSLMDFPYYHKTRMNLALSHILSYDRANSEYQLYVLDEHMKPRFGKQELAYYNQVFGGSDSLRRKKLVRPTSEYQTIFFPLVYELQQPRIYSMDCQRYNESWGQAWQHASEAVKNLKARAKADPTLPEAATVQKIAASSTAYNNFWKDSETSLQAYQAMSTPRYDTLDEAVNFYGGEALYGAPGFPTEQIQAMKAQWKLRNEGMCANIVRQARAQGARRVVVAVGASHGHTMRDMLNQLPGVKAVGFNDLP